MKVRALAAKLGPWMVAVCLVSSSVFAIGDQWRNEAEWEKEKPHGEPTEPGARD